MKIGRGCDHNPVGAQPGRPGLSVAGALGRRSAFANDLSRRGTGGEGAETGATNWSAAEATSRMGAGPGPTARGRCAGGVGRALSGSGASCATWRAGTATKVPSCPPAVLPAPPQKLSRCRRPVSRPLAWAGPLPPADTFFTRRVTRSTTKPRTRPTGPLVSRQECPARASWASLRGI